MKHATRARAAAAAALLSASSALVGLAPPAQATESSAVEAEQRLQWLINAERGKRGLRPLALNSKMREQAEGWSTFMNFYDRWAHHPYVEQQMDEALPGWVAYGENVAVNVDAFAVHNWFMSSPAHRAQILGDYTQMGVGVSVESDRIWVTERFGR